MFVSLTLDTQPLAHLFHVSRTTEQTDAVGSVPPLQTVFFEEFA